MEHRPGLNRRRLARLVRSAVDRCHLDLSGMVVLTEAASGAYLVTPVLAALAGAKHVYALTRSSAHGSVETVAASTGEVAELLGVENRLEIITEISPEALAEADIVTNSGHLRPLDRAAITGMKTRAAIPLMYEAWEFRPSDLDLAACRQRGIALAGTNERHPDVGVFDYLGIMAVKLLLDAGVAVHSSSLLVLCDNPFLPFIEAGLKGCGAALEAADKVAAASGRGWDAVLVARQPACGPAFGDREARDLAARAPGAVVAQFWGEVDRSSLENAGLGAWPPEAPLPGHMGILPSDVGPEPVVRLQAGGLKVGEILARSRASGASAERAEAAAEASGWGQRLER